MKHIAKCLFGYTSFFPSFYGVFVGYNSKNSQAGQNPDKEPNSAIIAPENKLPLMSINTNGNPIVDEPITIKETGQATFNGFLGIGFRGLSSHVS